jgi:hypothetical protein
METTLVIVTGISLVLALGLGVLLWRLLRDERQRADARVAALVDGFAARSTSEPAPASEARTAAATARSDWREAPADGPMEHVDLSTDTDWLSQFPSAARESAAPAPTRVEAVDSPAFDFDLPRASDSARVLFGQVEDAERANEPNHLMTASVAAALLVGLVLAIWTVSHLVITMTAAAAPATAPAAAASSAASPATASSATASSTAASSAVAPASAAGASAPLELLALRHDQNGSTLTISGLVRNPPNAARQDQLTAVVFFFNQRGDFLTSVRAPLDFRALAPGDESPFQVSAPAPAGVSRFRVSFRHDEGDVVPHVDRRQTAGS